MGVEGEQETCLVAIELSLESPERFDSDEERPFHCTVVPPEPNGMSGRVIESALVREREHRPAHLRWR